MVILAILLLACFGMLYALPLWVARFRAFSFARSEGSKGILLPNADLSAEDFRSIYAHPHAHIRSRGAKFSNLVWYLLAPGSHMHQEVMEEGEEYNAVSRVTREIIGVSSRQLSEMITPIAENALGELQVQTHKALAMRDFFMPVFADFFFQLLFKNRPSSRQVKIIVENALDFIETTKFHKLPNFDVRDRVIELIGEQIQSGHFSYQFSYPFSELEKCYYIRGLFLTSGVTQLSEAMAHVLLCLSTSLDLQRRLASEKDRALLSHVIDEAMRLYPLFGVAFRIVSDDIQTKSGQIIPKGSVTFFKFEEFHRVGFEKPECFHPERWASLKKTGCNFMPFGESKNHPCPAGGLSKLLLGRCIEIVLRNFEVRSSATHTRALTNRGPCLLVKKGAKRSLKLPLFKMWLSDRLHIFQLSLRQLIIGFEIKRRAKTLGLASKKEGVVTNALDTSDDAQTNTLLERRFSSWKHSHTKGIDDAIQSRVDNSSWVNCEHYHPRRGSDQTLAADVPGNSQSQTRDAN